MHAGYGMAVSAVYMTYTIQNLKGYLVKLWKMTFVICICLNCRST